MLLITNYAYRKILPMVFSLMVGLCAAAAANGQVVDPNFYPVITNNDYSVVTASAVQPDGKVVIAGSFGPANGFKQIGVARLSSNGQTDETFQPVTLSNGGYAGFVYDLKIQPDGKILIAGGLGVVNGQTRRGIARLNANGSLDPSFAAALSDVGYSVNIIKLQPDGKILAGGTFPSGRNLIRLNDDGTIDTSFRNPLPISGELTELILQPDGRIIVAYQIYEEVWKTKIVRLTSAGGFDTSFATVEVLGTGASSSGSPTVDAMLLQADGRIVVGGSLTSIARVSKSRIARLNFDGTVDNSFQTTSDAAVFTLTMQPDGRILASGIFSQINGSERKFLVRLNADGSLDDSLNASFPGPFTTIQTTFLQPDGKIIIGGQFINIGGKIRYRVARLNSDGTLDDQFAFVLIGSPGLVYLVVPRADGKTFVAGSFSYVGDERRDLLALINRDGTLDKSFQNVRFGDNFDVSAVLPLPDKKVLVAGRLFAHTADGRLYFNLVRYNADGTIDTTFPDTLTPGSSSVNSLARQPDGKILLGGLFTDINGNPQSGVIRINSDGSPDSSFHTEVSGSNYAGVAKIALQPDGKIIIGGYFAAVNGVSRSRIARLNPDGSLDTTFQNGMAGFNNVNNLGSVTQIELQPDGKLLAAGEFDSVNGTNRKYLARLNPDGSLDGEFLNNFTGADNLVTAVALERSGKILLAGFFNMVNGAARRGLARLNPDGSLDTSFSITFETGAFSTAYSLAVESSGNALVGGSFGLVNNQTRAGLFRIINSRPTKFDFDGDGKADISVYRPDGGFWYLLESNKGFTGAQFGVSTDKLVPADYDGDGVTDLAVYRAGIWYLQRSTAGFTGIAFGAPDDIPQPADFNGDGRADLAVWRPSNGIWYVYNLVTNSFTAVQFGASTDKPVAADYDGDGVADYAVYRPSNGTWYVQRSKLGFTGMQFGEAADKPVPADYDGDGRTDIAVYRPSNGVWYLQRSQLGFTGIQFGISTDSPTPADYDGDGKTDLAVFRNGTWYLQRSQAGFTGIQFGSDSDKPVPNAFIP